MTNINNAIGTLINNKPARTFRVPAYISLPSDVLKTYKNASAKAGVDMAYVLRQAIPAYAESGIDSGVLREWDEAQPDKSSIVTSIPVEMHQVCVEIADREGVNLVAVYRAALAQMFGISPKAKMVS